MIRNYITIKLHGLNQERLLNNLSKNFQIYNIIRNNSNFIQFDVKYSQKKKIKKYLIEKNIEFSILENGLFSKVRNLFKSVGLITGIVLSILLYSLQYFFVWEIKVYGSENNQNIVNFTEKTLKSRLKTQINTKNIEILLKKEFNEISSISASIVGQTLIININPKVTPEEMEGNFQAIVAQNDGQITEIKLIQGTLNCKVGDIVQKGEILVFPYIIDSQGEKREVQPKAEIKADVWLKEKTIHYENYIKTERTNRKIEVSEVYVNKTLLYRQNKKIPFKEYEVEIFSHPLTKNLILPLTIKKYIYYQTETFQVYEPFEDCQDKIIEDTRLKTLIFLNKNEIIKEENFYIEKKIDCYEITYIITVNRNIGGS